MSYDVALKCHCCESTVTVELHEEGGTYLAGGSTEGSLNVTYNYSEHFDFDALNGKTAVETLEEIGDAVKALGTERDSDYWKPTQGNAGYALSILLRWATRYPSAVWEVS